MYRRNVFAKERSAHRGQTNILTAQSLFTVYNKLLPYQNVFFLPLFENELLSIILILDSIGL
jgi:hypothetical protein